MNAVLPQKNSRCFYRKEEWPLSVEGRDENFVVPSLGGDRGHCGHSLSESPWLGLIAAWPLQREVQLTGKGEGWAASPSICV